MQERGELMNSQNKIQNKFINRDSYKVKTEKKGENVEVTKEEDQKKADVDTVELHGYQRYADAKDDPLFAYLEKLKELKQTNQIKQKQNVSSNAAAIKTEILMTKNSLMARMALSKAYRELSSLTAARHMGDGENSEVEVAISQMKKIIRAGNMKVRNLTKEEQAQQRLQRAAKEYKRHQVEEMKDELNRKRKHHRRKEQQTATDDRPQGFQNKNDYIEGRMEAEMSSVPANVPMTDIPATAITTAAGGTDAGAAAISANPVDTSI